MLPTYDRFYAIRAIRIYLFAHIFAVAARKCWHAVFSCAYNIHWFPFRIQIASHAQYTSRCSMFNVQWAVANTYKYTYVVEKMGIHGRVARTRDDIELVRTRNFHSSLFVMETQLCVAIPLPNCSATLKSYYACSVQHSSVKIICWCYWNWWYHMIALSEHYAKSNSTSWTIGKSNMTHSIDNSDCSAFVSIASIKTEMFKGCELWL